MNRHCHGDPPRQHDSAEYEELPELTEEMLGDAVVRKAVRPLAKNPRVQVTIRLPPDVLARWKATGPGWQTRMAKRLEEAESTG